MKKIDWNKQHIIWIRTGKVGSSSFHFAFAGKSPGNDFIEHNDITIKPKFGKIIEVHSDNVGYAEGILTFKQKYPQIWESAFKVLIIRNPYDRFISAWKHLLSQYTFEQLMEIDLTKISEPIKYHITRPLTQDLIVNGRLDVNFTIRFENLQCDFDNFCQIIGFPQTQLAHIRKGNHLGYKSYYNKKKAIFVYHLMQDDFRYLGYSKDSWKH
jgi:hypothetical protein